MPKDCFDIPKPPVSVNGLNNGLSIVDDELFNTVCPINPLTGHRDDMISRLFSGDTTDSERQLILSQLANIKGVSSPAGLSDDDILSLIPSRYMSDPVELDRYRELVDNLRDSAVPTPVEPVPVEPAPVDSAPAE
ncbi:hypothetical protein [Prevotella melaninogenica]|uniref:hypothetical protein n=1 Tax=Prevotella melaninogenica TaxID=28132 RepID=UPI001C5F05F5|nr:hypothetical protein [Prevotella melaninogenica]MBW4899555.1 hypothetical protein [Prevotella melaninogenica]